MSIYKKRSVYFEEKARAAESGGRPEEALVWIYQSTVLLLDGYLVEYKKFEPPRGHDQRNRYIGACPELARHSKRSKFGPAYQCLKGVVGQFRYDPQYEFRTKALQLVWENHALLKQILDPLY